MPTHESSRVIAVAATVTRRHPAICRQPAVLARLVVLSLALAGSLALSARDPSPAAVPTAKPAYELPVTGRNIPRNGGGWINGQLADFWLVLTFFDADKKPIPPDVKHGFVQFRKPGTNIRTPLYRKGDTLVSTEKVTPPYVFFVALNLYTSTDDQTAENYSFQYP